MGHPAIENHLPFAFEVLFLVDEEFRPLAVPVIKGTFDIASGRCPRSEKQVPISVTGECWGEDPETSSYKYEPEVAFFKPATDVVLVGHAHAPRASTTAMDVPLTVGPLRKTLRVFGERMWIHAAGTVATTHPVAFEKMPLVYERAFGGWDRNDPDPSRHACEARNPIGTGFARSLPKEGLRLRARPDRGRRRGRPVRAACHTMPLREVLTQAEGLKADGMDGLKVARFRGAYRLAAQSLNLGM